MWEGKNEFYLIKKGIMMFIIEWLMLESFLDGMIEVLKNHLEC